MAKTPFYNDNANRDFPFLEGTSFVPFSAVVAAGFVLGPGTGFVHGEHTVFLARVSRSDGKLWFYFSSDAPGLIGRYLVFSRELDDPAYAIEYTDSANEVVLSVPDEDDPQVIGVPSLLAFWSGSLPRIAVRSPLAFWLGGAAVPATEDDEDSVSDSTSVDCDVADDFSGFIITGPLDALLELLGEGEEITGEATVEPGLLQDLTRTYARSLNVANADRTRYQPPVDCDDVDWPVSPDPLYVRATCVTKPIVFVPGYNLLVLQNDFDNSLTFSAAVGAGDGEPCDQVTVFDGETAPENSLFLDGSPACNEVVRQIAGVSGPLVPIVGGTGVTVSFEPGTHTVVVDVDLHNLAVCGTELFTADTDEDECDHESVDESGTPGTRVTLPVPIATGVGHFSLTHDAFGTATLPSPIADGTGTFTQFNVGVGDATLPMPIADGSGEFTQVNAGVGEAMLPVPVASGDGEVDGGIEFSAVGDAALPVPTADGEGSFSSPITGFGDVTLPMPTAAGAGNNNTYALYVARRGDKALFGPSLSGLADTRFISSAGVHVRGVSGGSGTSNLTGEGGGGQTSPSHGTTRFNGGNGGSTFNGTLEGGGGGGGAGTSGAGSTAGIYLAGAGGAGGGGAGGNGGHDAVLPVDGTFPGGGGGGAASPGTFVGRGADGQLKISYNNPGLIVETYTPGWYGWTPPVGVTTFTVECWGSGGDGGPADGPFHGGGGGGGGAYAARTISI